MAREKGKAPPTALVPSAVSAGDRFELVLHRGVHKRTDPFRFDDADQEITWAAPDRGIIDVPEPLTDAEEQRLVALARRWLTATR